MHEDEKRATAYHESGHAIVAESLKAPTLCIKLPLCRVAVRSASPGNCRSATASACIKTKCSIRFRFCFGGRIAEDLFVGRISTGASNDFERATQIARANRHALWYVRANGADGVWAKMRARCFSVVR